MITTSITIKQYLAEYLYTKFQPEDNCNYIRIPETDDLYDLLWHLMAKRPLNISPVDRGNITIALPHRRAGKNPEYYNYISQRSAHIFEKRVKQLFSLELHQFLDNNVISGYRYTHQDMVNLFMCKYGLESITEDALLKNYYRWRDYTRKKEKRKYRKQ